MTCTKWWPEIQHEAKLRRLRGAVVNCVKQYIDGVDYVHHRNVGRHCKPGSLHEFAARLSKSHKRNENSDEATLEPDPEPTSSHSISENIQASKDQPGIDTMLMGNSRDAYQKLFRTAFFIALEEISFSKFSSLVDLQKKNGVKFLDGKANRKSCAVMIDFLASVVKEDLQDLLGTSNFLSALCDGSEAKKTKLEKELVYAKVVKNGIPICIFLKCQHMKDFGGTDAVSLKTAFLDAFTSFGIDFIGEDTHKVVSVCADGASVNMGSKSGAVQTLQNDIKHLLVVHCSLHKLELAVKDACKNSPEFQVMDDMMTSVHYLFKNSGKNWRMMSQKE